MNAEHAELTLTLTFTIRPQFSKSGWISGMFVATVMDDKAERPPRWKLATRTDRALWKALAEFLQWDSTHDMKYGLGGLVGAPKDSRRKPGLDHYDGDDGIWHGGKEGAREQNE